LARGLLGISDLRSGLTGDRNAMPFLGKATKRFGIGKSNGAILRNLVWTAILFGILVASLLQQFSLREFCVLLVSIRAALVKQKQWPTRLTVSPAKSD
jgi:hypothetical protein